MSTSLFDNSLLTSTTLPDGLTVRSLRSDDYDKGYDTIFDALVAGSTLSSDSFSSIFTAMSKTADIYYVIVITDSASGQGTSVETHRTIVLTRVERIVGSATLLVERKFLRGGSLAGHVEDVVVAPSHQGKKLGRVLIDVLTALGKTLGCYKIILDCSDDNVGFYEKCGYAMKGREMKMYL